MERKALIQAIAPERTGSVPEALANAKRLLATDPELACEQAREILKVEPGNGSAQLILGLAHSHAGRGAEAASALRRAAELDPNGPAWRALGDQLTLMEDGAGADAAYAQAIRASVREPKLMQAAMALCEGKLAACESILRPYLHENPTDVAAIRMMAELGARLGRFEDAEKLLSRCLELAPSFLAARHNYAIVLHRQMKSAEALRQIDILLEADPHNPSYRFLRATALTRIGEYDAAIDIYEDVLRQHPGNARAWLSLGHACKTAGRRQESIDAYLRSIESAPNFGEAYWSLANMKTFTFDDAMIARMETQLARADIGEEDRFHLHYALGKALEDRQDYQRSFGHYATGARLRREGLAYDDADTSEAARQHIALFDREFVSAHAGQGSPAPDPIFVVGLPRSGSTLVEQILASHSMVEGTMELPDIIMLAKRLGGGKVRGGAYPAILRDLSPAQIRALGEEYIERTRVQRKSGKPFFIDKMPNNSQHVGFINLILPNAKIVDVRRHPMAACFSAFKQHFARGQGFSYDLDDLGRYYADYVELMDCFDAAAPRRVHRIFYEDLVEDAEAEIRRLLDYCGLPFEPECLAFHANTRAVRTASSEQVRQPIYSGAVDHWRHYEPWLDSLKAALGPALEAYPRQRN
ncbi:MAG: sulfotransferase [Hyphomonadaceae bacterium]